MLSATAQSATAARAVFSGASSASAAARCAAAAASARATAASRVAVAWASKSATFCRGPSTSVSSHTRCASALHASASAMAALYRSTYSVRRASPACRSAAAAAAATAAASAVAAHVSGHRPARSSLPSQQSHTPSPTRLAGISRAPVPSSAHSKRFAVAKPEQAAVRGSSAPSAQSQ